MPKYRKKKGGDTWHWCGNCSRLPTWPYEDETHTKRPPSGELCNECRSKEKNGNCTPIP